MTSFENVINQIRDLLRNEGITAMDSINHCLLFVFMKFLTDERCELLNIDSKYAFDNIMNIRDDNELLERIFASGKICLVNILKKSQIFSIDFKIKSIINLKNILKKISGINIDHHELNSDLVGLIYELHLKSGSSNAMRDLGQFFSNRPVIKYMIELCNPKIKNKKTGEIETIMDPSMGTGGFLTMAIKHLNKNNKKIDWKINKNNIIGFDIDQNVSQMALLNAFIETGMLFSETIIQHNSLTEDYTLKDNTLINKVDVILANMPFGLKNIIHAECCERIKKLKIRGTKSEPLFLQLMMLSLNEGGRCVVIVPDGVLFNDTKLHSETRKYLIENLNLKKIISLNGDFFINTGVKSSILFFVNDGKTKEVEFSDLVLENNNLKENLTIKVSYDKIVENNYNLFVNKYNAVKEEQIKGLEYMNLEDICEFNSSKYNSGIMDNNGKYDFYSGIANNPAGKHSTYNFDNDEYIAIIKGGGAGKGKYGDQIGLGKSFYLRGKNAISNGLYVLTLKSDKIVMRYLYYYLLSIKNKIMDLATYTTGLGNIKQESLKKLQIPIPSIQTQYKIIKNLDNINKQIERLKKENEKLKLMSNGFINDFLSNGNQDLQLDDNSDNSESDNDDETNAKDKTYILEGINVYKIDKNGKKGELYGNYQNSKIKKANKEITL